MFLWILFALFTAFTFVIVLYPVIWRANDKSIRSDYDVAVYKDQLKEVEADLERGLINEQEASTAKVEVSRRLIKVAELSEKENIETQEPYSEDKVLPSHIFAILIAVVCIPVSSLAFYLMLGSPKLPDLPLEARFKSPEGKNNIQFMVARVEQRLKSNPNDGRGWEVLAPVYLKMGRFREAANAYAMSTKLLGTTAERLTGYGEALVRANNEIVPEDAQKAFRKALELDSNLVLPRVRLNLALEQAGKKEEAISAWQKLVKDVKGNAPLIRMVNERISKLTRQEVATAPMLKKPEKQSELRGPSSEDIKAAQSMSANDRMAMINNMVEGLSERLKENGGSLQEWIRLIRAYNVLGKKDMASKAFEDARKNLKNDKAAVSQLEAFAKQMGLAS